MRSRWLLLAAVPLSVVGPAVGAGRLAAQVVTGTVVQADSVTPARGVLVEARLAGSSEPVRVLTTERGTFRFTMPAADTARVRVLRPGYRPASAQPTYVAAGATRDLRIVLEDRAITLAPTTVRESRVCGERADAAAWQLWEQARTVLQTTALTERDSSLDVRTLEFQGQAAAGGATLVKDSTVLFVPVDPPFPRAHYDSLFRYGYIRRDARVTTYYAPNAQVLLDERFVGAQCFRLVDADSTPEGLVGVRFEPARATWRTDVVGTFWLDATTFELRRIDFGYLNPPPTHRVYGTGGEVLFTRLETGHWIMNEWSIRMASPSLFGGSHWRMGRGSGPLVMRREDELISVAPSEVQRDHHLWSRSQLIVSVRLGDRVLFHQPVGERLARRMVPRDTMSGR